MGRLKGRLDKLENREQAQAIEIEEAGLTSRQTHSRRAFVRATPEEQKALKKLLADGEDLPLWRLWERVLRREASTLADDIRVHWDLLHRELAALEQELREQGYDRRAGELRRPFSEVVTAKVNRRTVIIRGAEPIEDPEEARNIIEQITAPDTSLNEVIQLIGWPGGET
jgi:hypothetical protein